MTAVRNFISDRRRRRDLKDQLHAVWYVVFCRRHRRFTQNVHAIQAMSRDTLCWQPPPGIWCRGLSTQQARRVGQQYVPSIHVSSRFHLASIAVPLIVVFTKLDLLVNVLEADALEKGRLLHDAALKKCTLALLDKLCLTPVQRAAENNSASVAHVAVSST